MGLVQAVPLRSLSNSLHSFRDFAVGWQTNRLVHRQMHPPPRFPSSSKTDSLPWSRTSRRECCSSSPVIPNDTPAFDWTRGFAAYIHNMSWRVLWSGTQSHVMMGMTGPDRSRSVRGLALRDW